MHLLEDLYDEVFVEKQLRVYVLRLDKLHPLTGGNKYFKLKYNLRKAKEENLQTVLSFGGAYSNHIASLAAFGKEEGLKTIGVIRGDELNSDSNHTLKKASEAGMSFHFVSRNQYANKNAPGFIAGLKSMHGDFFLIPEGGSNAHAVKGCLEIPALINIPFDYMITACGTGGTLAGVSLSMQAHQQAIGIPLLKGAKFLENDILQLQQDYFAIYNDSILNKKSQLIYNYHFGGYAKSTDELLAFKKHFERHTGILLDTIYNAKSFFALYDLARKNFFPPGKTIVIVHTGGLQGNSSPG